MTGDPLAGHERWMRAALSLGRRSMGRAAPNPAVAALVVKRGAVRGRGVTAPGGRPHAEPLAILEAGAAAPGATLYVTLEPCSHHGRTPPCTDAIVAAGITTVVYGLGDPDARVAGRGLARLRDAGVTVIGPVLPEACRCDHLGHILRVTEGRPAVTLKLAETADGFAAGPPGSGRLLITGAAANAAVHRMRLLHDAVMVGIGTALADDPLLTVRLPGVTAQPARVVLDRHLRLPADAALVRSVDIAPLVVVTGEQAPPDRVQTFEQAGVTVLHARAGQAGRDGRPVSLDVADVLQVLGRHGFTRILCEGGPTLAAALLDGDLADAVALLTGTQRLAEDGVPALPGAMRARLADPAWYRLADDRALGSDRQRSYERIRACSPDS